jgi:hypothetical protein
MPTAITLPPAAFPPPPAPEINAIPWPVAVSQTKPGRPPRRPAIDVGAVITRALTAAGLMK